MPLDLVELLQLFFLVVNPKALIVEFPYPLLLAIPVFTLIYIVISRAKTPGTTKVLLQESTTSTVHRKSDMSSTHMTNSSMFEYIKYRHNTDVNWTFYLVTEELGLVSKLRFNSVVFFVPDLLELIYGSGIEHWKLVLSGTIISGAKEEYVGFELTTVNGKIESRVFLEQTKHWSAVKLFDYKLNLKIFMENFIEKHEMNGTEYDASFNNCQRWVKLVLRQFNEYEVDIKSTETCVFSWSLAEKFNISNSLSITMGKDRRDSL
jgi:hypothetical protein